MHSNREILRLRVSVGYLGERHGSNWWSSSFLDPTSEAFIAPIFGATAANARIVGVTEAARRIHDDAIGVGRIFHAFRLPEALEHELHRTVGMTEGIAIITSVEAALEELDTLSTGRVAAMPGPVHVGPFQVLADDPPSRGTPGCRISGYPRRLCRPPQREARIGQGGLSAAHRWLRREPGINPTNP
jgi:hypothetical protein